MKASKCVQRKQPIDVVMLIIYFFSFIFALTPASEQTAHDNMCPTFNSFGCTVGKPPCQETWTVCENGFVVALNIGAELSAAWPDISGFTHLRNLSLIDGFNMVTARNLAKFSLMTTLRHFSIGPALFPVPWAFSTFPATLGTDWANLEVCSISVVQAIPSLPPSVASWSKLRVFYLNQINDMLGAPTFSLPLSLTTWTSLESFFIWDVNIKPGQALPTLGTKVNITEYQVRDTVTDAVSEPLFTSLADDALFDSMRLSDFVISNLPFCTGTLPVTFGHATSLKNFIVVQTALTGSIPLNVFNLNKLETMILFGGFSGTLPTTIGGWKSIENLAMRSIKMSGTLPTEIGNFKKLKTLTLLGDPISAAKLSGNFHAQLANLAYVNLTDLTIVNTDLNGRIAEPFVKTPPSTLTSLIINDNKFQCTLPDWMIETIPSIASASLCNVSVNDFCQLPNPLQNSQKVKCKFALSHQPCLCEECPQSPPAQDCPDCNGVNGGSSTYDQCDVCDGNNLSCADCNGVPNGPSRYDICSVCNGTNACADCFGVAFGAADYDYCDVCGGDGTSCLDCQNTPYGTHTYDSCDVCGGDGLSCQNCAGGPSNEIEYDLCGNCVNMTEPGYMPTCFDCAGVANGMLIRDLCGVCNGTTSTCNPTEIGAGVVGLRVVVPWLIFFAVLDVLLLIVYVCQRRQKAIYGTSSSFASSSASSSLANSSNARQPSYRTQQQQFNITGDTARGVYNQKQQQFQKLN